MIFQRGDYFFWTLCLGREFGKFKNDPQGDGVKVGVDEPTPIDSRSTTKNFNIHSLVIANSKTVLDDFSRQRQRFFDSESEI